MSLMMPRQRRRQAGIIKLISAPT